MPNEGSYDAALERSNRVHEDLKVNPGKYTMLTGDRPTGRLHLGHYFGTLVDRVRLQEMGVHTNVIIADYHPGQRLQHGRGLPCLRHRPREDHDLHPLRRARGEPAHAALPLAGVRGRARAQPHGQGRAGGLRPRADGPASDLPCAPGLRHPLLQGQHRPGRPRPAPAHRGHQQDRPPLQQALREGLPRGDGPSHLNAAAARP